MHPYLPIRYPNGTIEIGLRKISKTTVLLKIVAAGFNFGCATYADPEIGFLAQAGKCKLRCVARMMLLLRLGATDISG